MAALCQAIVILFAYLAIAKGQEGVPEVEINVLYKPENCKREAKAGDYVTLTFMGYLPSDTGNEQFDNSDNKGPVHVKLHDPSSTAMLGWHKAIEGMCVNEKREVLIPHGPLTANHRLPNTNAPPEGKDVSYQFHARNIQDKPPAANLFKQMDYNSDRKITKEEALRYVEEEGLGGIEKFKAPKEAINEIFNQMDKDKDGAISHEEFPGPKHDEF